jgi:hypothetical protein
MECRKLSGACREELDDLQTFYPPSQGIRNKVVEKVPLNGRAKVRYNRVSRGDAVAEPADVGRKRQKVSKKRLWVSAAICVRSSH